MNKKKTMGYAGSLISQNFGETDPYHGFLIWNLKEKTSEHIKLENPFCFIEGILDQDKLILLYWDIEINWKEKNEMKKYIPKQCNFRIHLGEDKNLNMDFITKIKKELPLIKLQQKYFETNSKKIKIQQNPETINDILWIRSYIIQKFEKNPNIEYVIQEITKQYKNSISIGFSSQSPSWEIKKISFQNMFGYGESNELDFTKIQSNTITGIFGKNSYGKSTLIDILTFLLFGKITRNSHGNTIPKEIIHINENKSYGEIEFMVGNVSYKICKTCQRMKNDKIKIIEKFLIYTQEGWIDHSEEHRKKTDKIIESLIGNLDSFVFTNICLQQREKQFREMTQKDRKEFLYELFGLNWFEKYKKEKDDELKKLKGEIKVYKNKINDYSSLYWIELINKLNIEIQEIQEKLLLLNQDLNKIDNDKESIISNICNTNFNSYKEVYDIKLKYLKKIDNLKKQEEQYEIEKKKLIELTMKNDIYMIRNQIQNLEKEMEIYDTILNNNDLIQEWLKKDKKEWDLFYKNYKETIQSSENITKDWENIKTDLETKILNLEKENFEFEEEFVKIDEWNNLENKIKEYESKLKILKEKINEPIIEINIHTENVIEEMNNYFSQLKFLNCSNQMIKQNLNELTRIQLNPDCYACQSNPYYFQKQKYMNDLQSNEEQIIKLRQKIIEIIPKLDFEIPSEFTLDEINDYINNHIKNIKSTRNELLKKREYNMKKMDFYQIQIKYYYNTKNYVLNKQKYSQLNELKEQIIHHPFKTKYQQLLSFISNSSSYENIEIAFQKQSCRELTQIQNELDKYKQLEIILNKSSKNLLEINENILELKKNILQFENNIENIDKEMIIIKNNEILYQQKHELEKNRKILMDDIDEMTQMLIINKSQLEKNTILQNEWILNYENYQRLEKEIEIIELLLECIDRDGLPLYLLNNYLPIIENDINEIVQIFLDKKLVIKIKDKDIILGLEEKQNITNFMGGMESFIFDLTLKMSFSKFSRRPKSNFFIIDEGISVFDQDRINNIHILLNFLTSISEKTFLISHIPTIKDFVTQSIEIIKDENKKSHLYCNF
jgi:DNA repair exonuclease SbcCD ATPase subunit